MYTILLCVSITFPSIDLSLHSESARRLKAKGCWPVGEQREVAEETRPKDSILVILNGIQGKANQTLGFPSCTQVGVQETSEIKRQAGYCGRLFGNEG